MTESIVVGVDGSGRSVRALVRATREAVLRHRALPIVHVLPRYHRHAGAPDSGAWAAQRDQGVMAEALSIAEAMSCHVCQHSERAGSAPVLRGHTYQRAEAGHLTRRPKGMSTMTARCVLIGPDGGLDFLEAAPEMFRCEADPYNGDTSEFVMHRATVSGVGMRGLAACAAVLATDRYPPNQLAGRPVRALGGTALCGLDDSQCRLITDVYATIHEGA
ncbi:hypothetical protein [Streptomyces noursei]|uniref:hypothetical protein n=1 Tax=Streptomyces noursei TaxID=1971 RepID=UPI001964E752|nr:hypothetical protein [Streptomyces noursei]QRX90220.1 hypothetical protein JNO44_04520 [Streptomyces noursei]